MNPRSWEQMVSSTKVAKWNLGCKLLPWRRLRLVHPRAFLSYNVQDQEESEPSCILPKLWKMRLMRFTFICKVHIYLYIVQACVRALSKVSLTTRHSRHAIVLKNVKPKREVWCGSWVCRDVLDRLRVKLRLCAVTGGDVCLIVGFNYSKPSPFYCTYCNMVFVILLFRCWCMHLLATTCMPHQVHRPAWLP